MSKSRGFISLRCLWGHVAQNHRASRFESDVSRCPKRKRLRPLLSNYLKLSVVTCHGLRMVRKNQSGKSPSKKSRKNDLDSSHSNVMFTPYSNSNTSVHKRNLCIVSFPIIFLFNVLRSLLYQFFVILRFIYCSSSTFFVRHRKLDLENGETGACLTEEVTEMAQAKSPGPGPGDPLLAKQKHHHRRAFEYISKALKIDEENEGTASIKFCY